MYGQQFLKQDEFNALNPTLIAVRRVFWELKCSECRVFNAFIDLYCIANAGMQKDMIQTTGYPLTRKHQKLNWQRYQIESQSPWLMDPTLPKSSAWQKAGQTVLRFHLIRMLYTLTIHIKYQNGERIRLWPWHECCCQARWFDYFSNCWSPGIYPQKCLHRILQKKKSIKKKKSHKWQFCGQKSFVNKRNQRTCDMLNLEADETQQQKSTSGFTPVKPEQGSEAKVDIRTETGQVKIGAKKVFHLSSPAQFQ